MNHGAAARTEHKAERRAFSLAWFGQTADPKAVKGTIEDRQHKPKAILCASKGGRYMEELWRRMAEVPGPVQGKSLNELSLAVSRVYDGSLPSISIDITHAQLLTE